MGAKDEKPSQLYHWND